MPGKNNQSNKVNHRRIGNQFNNMQSGENLPSVPKEMKIKHFQNEILNVLSDDNINYKKYQKIKNIAGFSSEQIKTMYRKMQNLGLI